MSKEKLSLEARRRTRPHVTQADIETGLKELGVSPGDVVFAHSSLSAFGYVEGGADAVIDALLAAVGPEGTVVLPTFTWAAFHDQHGVVFDVLNTPCETGRIPETFRRRAGVKRGIHICHSMAAFGARADEALGDGVSPFGKGSAFDHLYRLDAWNLFLGVTMSCCTAAHSAEELVQVPYRAYRDFKDCAVVLPDGRRIPSPSVEFMRQNDWKNDFAKLEGILARAGLLRSCQIGAARCLNARLRDIVDLASRMLRENPNSLSKPPASGR